MSEKQYHIYSFEKLDVYQIARKFRYEIVKITKNFPKEEKYQLISQIRRSVSSISTNLAEGSGRAGNIDKAHFTNISYSSALETIDHLNAALDLEYIPEGEYRALRIQLDEIINKLNALYKYQLKEEVSLKEKLRK